MKHSLKIGLFIGVTVASASSLILRFVHLNYWTLVAVLYLYSIVGALTSYLVHNNLRKRIKEKIEKKLDEIIAKLG